MGSDETAQINPQLSLEIQGPAMPKTFLYASVTGSIAVRILLSIALKGQSTMVAVNL